VARHRSFVATLVLAGTLVMAAGCASPHAGVDSPDESGSSLATMPAVVGRTVEQAHDAFGSTDVRVRVALPAVVDTITETFKSYDGTYVDRSRRYRRPARRFELDSAAGKVGRFIIVAQRPKPGTSIDTSSVVVLTLGPHPWQTAPGSWMAQHARVTKRAGAAPCLEACHKEYECSNCHTGD